MEPFTTKAAKSLKQNQFTYTTRNKYKARGFNTNHQELNTKQS